MPDRRYQSYVICTTPRSGSTLFCRLLAETGVAGRPDSHFHVPSLERWLEDYDLAGRAFPSRRQAVEAVFAAARQRGTSANGIFGLRMQRDSFAYFMSQADLLYPGLSTDRERFQAAFGPTLFVYLTRSDKLAQAVSRVKAEQTGLWHRNADGSEYERLAPPQEPAYDAAAIAHHMADLTALDAAWAKWFAEERPNTLRVDYGRLSRDPQGVVAEVLSAIGLDPTPARAISPPTARLADATSAEWIARFRREQALDSPV